MTDILQGLAYLNGQPTAQAKLKVAAEHFVVKEEFDYPFSGSGEHLMVRIRKTGENTTFVANELAKACGVKSKQVSWAGLKDRHAVTEQWLSVHLPSGELPDLSQLEQRHPTIQVLATDRHHKKLRPGDLSGNAFKIVLAEVSDIPEVEQRIQRVMQIGVPNYFGEQRFGRDGNNLSEARRWGRENVRTRDQNKRSLYLSTARSWIYNQIVSSRLDAGLFSRVLSGDILINEEGQIVAQPDNLAPLQHEFEQGRLAISAALAGDNALPTLHEALALELPQLDAEPDLMALIRGNRMQHDRRAISLKPNNLSYKIVGDDIILEFDLGAGSFATSVIRELVEVIPVTRHYP